MGWRGRCRGWDGGEGVGGGMEGEGVGGRCRGWDGGGGVGSGMEGEGVEVLLNVCFPCS